GRVRDPAHRLVLIFGKFVTLRERDPTSGPDVAPVREMTDQPGLRGLEESPVEPARSSVVPNFEWHTALGRCLPDRKAPCLLGASAETNHAFRSRRRAALLAIEPRDRHRQLPREIGIEIVDAARHVLRPGDMTVEAVASGDDPEVVGLKQPAGAGL